MFPVTLSEPNRTQFDLSWRMFGIPVRIHPMFWLVGIFLGWNVAKAWGMEYLAVFIAYVLWRIEKGRSSHGLETITIERR